MARLQLPRVTARRRELLKDFLESARPNNRMEDGRYCGMTREETMEVDRLLDHIYDFCRGVEARTNERLQVSH